MEIFLVSCNSTISGMTFLMVSLKELFFLQQPKPYIPWDDRHLEKIWINPTDYKENQNRFLGLMVPIDGPSPASSTSQASLQLEILLLFIVNLFIWGSNHVLR